MKLGDTLELIFRKTGIKAIVKYFYPDCNCDKRQAKLNEVEFKFKRK